MRRQIRGGQAGSRLATDSLSLIRSYDVDYNPSRPLRSSPLTASTIQGLPLELIDRLRSFPLFASAPDTFLGAIGKYLRPQLHQPHDYILTEGEDAKSMYWLVRGSVRVTSRDGESTYAELKPGAFFGEIGILMDIPRTATVIAKVRSLVVRLNKEDLQKELPAFPQVERAIREEAVERLAILQRKKKESSRGTTTTAGGSGLRKRSRDFMSGDVEMGEAGEIVDGEIISNKKRKSPSPGLAETVASSALGGAPLTVRQLLKELPLFSELPPEILHFLGVNAQPCTFAPLPKSSHKTPMAESLPGRNEQPQRVRARLKPGQYFGEVANLALAPKRTATVRSINAVECLRITGEVLDELWRRWSSDLRQQMEIEAKRRLKEAEDPDLLLPDAFDGVSDSLNLKSSSDDDWKRTVPTVTFSNAGPEISPTKETTPMAEPLDPDPLFNADLDNMRSKSRRGSLAPPPPESLQTSFLEQPGRQPSPPGGRYLASSPLKPGSKPSSQPSSPGSRTFHRRPSVISRYPAQQKQAKSRLPDPLLVLIFQQLDLAELMQLRQVSMHWHKLITTSPDLVHNLDLSLHNRRVTDSVLCDIIGPFVGTRPQHINMNNCFHITDEGFNALAAACGPSVQSWKMKSVWDVTGAAILQMVETAPNLEELDLSNCRKVGDNLLARIVGWIVPEQPPGVGPLPSAPPPTRRPALKRNLSTANAIEAAQPAPGTVIGSPKLKRLTLSYCKHVQDRSMAHIAAHAASRLESIDLTRCTSITDQGFQHWSVHNFAGLRRLVLADCTYLTDQAIVGVANAARGLKELDLSFCCALSDTATEVLSLGLTQLTHLDLAFCGSAVSDSSLRCIGLHLLELKVLSVRGCVRVTGQGVESVVDGCRNLEVFDVSQCKNLSPWLMRGGIQAVRRRGCKTRFDVVANGSWRTGH
ncbi:hypothetical protein H2203_006918 [Taxawa tesnikishii (nom. ined.)]|nr:hypothetical protein H2203_006918 [Dothideales sp. JES 119]